MPACCRHFRSARDFTEIEQRLLPALQTLKSASPGTLVSLALRGFSDSADRADCMERMNLAQPQGLADRLYAWLIRGALAQRQ